MKIKVKTDAFPGGEDNGDTSNKNESAEPVNFGLTVRPLTKELADEYGVEANSGVLVTAVEAGSVAEEKGIRAGDVITEVNRRPVTNMRQFREAISASTTKNGAIINFISKGTSRITVLKDQ